LNSISLFFFKPLGWQNGLAIYFVNANKDVPTTPIIKIVGKIIVNG